MHCMLINNPQCQTERSQLWNKWKNVIFLHSSMSVQFLFELLHASEQKIISKFMHIQEMSVLLHPIKSLFQKIIHFFSSCITFMSSAFLFFLFFLLFLDSNFHRPLWLTALNSGLRWFEDSDNWGTLDWLLSHLTLPASFISQ